MKKFIILAAIIPSIIFGQRPSNALDKVWIKDITEYRASQGSPIVRSATLDSIAKERFLAISGKYKSSNLGYIPFFKKFSEGDHGIPEIGLDPFGVFIKNRYPKKEGSTQEICVFEPNGEQAVLKKGSFVNYYKESKSHWEVASGNIPVTEIVTRYDGRLHKKVEFQRQAIMTNSKFGSYTGVFTVFDSFLNRNVDFVINVTIFE